MKKSGKEGVEKVRRGTWIRTLSLLAAMINQTVAVVGASTYAGAAWYQALSVAATVITALIAAWENNDWTSHARLGTDVLDALEDGRVTEAQVRKMLAGPEGRGWQR